MRGKSGAALTPNTMPEALNSAIFRVFHTARPAELGFQKRQRTVVKTNRR
jgi:hypothetical protein